MGRANALLKNLAVDKAIFNRLQGISIKATNHIHNNNRNQVQYLFSLDILEASWDGSTLVFNKKTSTGENNISFIRFTDRPYKFDKHYVNEEAEIYIDNLFRENPEGFNSFSKNPPNGVLVVQSDNSLKGKQEAFEIKLRTVSNGKISMILNLLENQNNIESFTNKPISLFIDNSNQTPQIGRRCRFYITYKHSEQYGFVTKENNKFICKTIHGNIKDTQGFYWFRPRRNIFAQVTSASYSYGIPKKNSNTPPYYTSA